MVEIRWTEKASNNLEDIFEYIASDSKIYASRFIKAIIKQTSILENQPLSGRIVPEFNDPEIRELIYRNYRIVYSVIDDNTIKILVVYHGAVNFNNITIDE